ncbi:hypothetical protein CGCFRS4_v015651 [Colletotrichum fructicola]|nr:hypothetical protein CGCFRS4_v015651 [Colletotrichum fructicola]
MAIKPFNRYNMDETGILKGRGSNGLVLGSSKTRSIRKKQPGSRAWTSLIECISATGEALPPHIIYKGKNVQKQWFPLDIKPYEPWSNAESWFAREVSLIIRGVPTIEAADCWRWGFRIAGSMMSILWTIAECVLKALWWPASIVIPIVLSFLLLAFLAGWAVEGLHACNMTHGGDFARVIRPEFDRRLVRHYAKTWVTTDAYGPVVFTDKIVVNEDIGKEYRFNRELVETCFNDVDAVERWLRVEMGKQDCFRPWYHAVHAGHYSEASRANDADDTYDADTEPAPCGYRLIHAHGPIAKAAADAKAPQEKPECPSPSGLFSDPASGLAGGTRMGQAPAAASPVPAKDGIPALGPALWGPTTPLAAAPSPGMFPPTPGSFDHPTIFCTMGLCVVVSGTASSSTADYNPDRRDPQRRSIHIGLVRSPAALDPLIAAGTVQEEFHTAAATDYDPRSGSDGCYGDGDGNGSGGHGWR